MVRLLFKLIMALIGNLSSAHLDIKNRFINAHFIPLKCYGTASISNIWMP